MLDDGQPNELSDCIWDECFLQLGVFALVGRCSFSRSYVNSDHAVAIFGMP